MEGCVSMETTYTDKPWETLRELIDAGGLPALCDFLDGMNPMETALAVSRLDGHEQNRLFTMLAPEDAADVIEDISDQQAADHVRTEGPPMKYGVCAIQELGEQKSGHATRTSACKNK